MTRFSFCCKRLSARRALVLALLLGSAATQAFAGAVTDVPNDFLPSFIGPHNGDLDVLSAQVTFDGVNFTFTSTENGPIGTTPGGLFVWGVDRGLHNQFFGAFRPGVLFDIAVVLRADGSGTVLDFAPNPQAPVDLAPGSVLINGNTITGIVPVSLLPTKGLAPGDYLVNVWPRTGLASNDQIADFAPEDSTFAVNSPEPGSVIGLVSGLVALGWSRRRGGRRPRVIG